MRGVAPGSAGSLKPFLAAPIVGSTGAVDFAFGGTGTPYLDQTPGGFWAPGLKGQVELFKSALGARKPSKNALYVIVTGANDYRDDAFNTPMALVSILTQHDGQVRLKLIGQIPYTTQFQSSLSTTARCDAPFTPAATTDDEWFQSSPSTTARCDGTSCAKPTN